MRRSLRVTGSFILNQRVVPDWWHPYSREDAHTLAKETLSAAIRRDEEEDAVSAAAATQRDGDAIHHRTAATQPGRVHLDDEELGEEVGHDEGRAVGSSRDLGHAGTEETGPTAERLCFLSLYELNALVATFTSNHDVDELSAALQYLRERLQQPLAPYHYHALFRVFNRSLDRDNVVQLFEVMAQRGETTQETYARAVDCVHCLAPVDSLARILEIVQAAQEAFGSLVAMDVSGSEAATVAAYGSGGEAVAAREDANRLPGPSSAEEATAASCPVLTSLLHHLATTCDGDPVAVQLVVLWVRALGVRLSDWDGVHLMSSLLRRADAFPRVRGLLGAFPGFPVGAVSPNAVLQRLEERGELPAGAGAASVLAQVAVAMRRSLVDAGVDMDAAVEVGCMNHRTTSLRTMLQHTLACFGWDTAGKDGAGLGGHGYNPALLFHAMSSMHSAMRDNAEAARVFLRAAEIEEAHWRKLQQQHNTAQAMTDTLDREGVDAGGDRAVEPFAVSHQYLMDIGSLLPTLSMRAREDMRENFTQLAQRMALAARESQLQDTLSHASGATAGGDGGGGRLLVGAAKDCAAAPPLRPSSADLIGLEGYALGFTRTYEEAAAALQTAVSRVDRTRARLPRETRLAFKQLAQYCCDHPLPNPKLTPAGLAERQKWGAYLDARDTALSLFGSAKQARDAMKHLYYGGGTLPSLRSDAVMAQDLQDTLRIFFGNDHPEAAAERGMSAFTAHRTTQPHIRCPAHAVPRHLYDPSVFNPYPHLMLRQAPVDAAQREADAAALQGDLFAELWRTLMNPAVMGNDLWYLRNTDMYLLLMRCLLHRLDWEAAAHLTTKMLEHSAFTYLMDHELTTVFREIGDPAGCLAFKVATKLFDGRITRDGQTKRERYHQEQFQ